ncbi:MAG: PKD domain-containing protein [Candidatus Thermoplasmatota archaeon]
MKKMDAEVKQSKIIYSQKIRVTWIAFILVSVLLIPSSFCSSDLIINYANTQPTIDGIFGKDEWHNATHIEIELNFYGALGYSELHRCELYIMNDASTLYISFLLYNEDYNSIAPEELNVGNDWYGDQFWVNFYWAEQNITYRDMKILEVGIQENYTNNISDWKGGKKDKHGWHEVSAGQHMGMSGPPDVVDFDAAFTHSNPVENAIGDYIFEFAMPLKGEIHNNTPLDLLTEPGATINIELVYLDKVDKDPKLRIGIGRYSIINATLSRRDNLIVKNRVPIPNIIADKKIVTIGEKIKLDAFGSFDLDGKIVEYTWDLGDGETSHAKVIEHKYNKSGTYIVTLNVVDDDDATNETSIIITVKEEKISFIN